MIQAQWLDARAPASCTCRRQTSADWKTGSTIKRMGKMQQIVADLVANTGKQPGLLSKNCSLKYSEKNPWPSMAIYGHLWPLTNCPFNGPNLSEVDPAISPTKRCLGSSLATEPRHAKVDRSRWLSDCIPHGRHGWPKEVMMLTKSVGLQGTSSDFMC